MHDHDNLGRREFLGTVGGLSIATLIAQGVFRRGRTSRRHDLPQAGAAPANAFPPSGWAATISAFPRRSRNPSA